MQSKLREILTKIIYNECFEFNEKPTHSGDCTNESHTCLLCLCENATDVIMEQILSLLLKRKELERIINEEKMNYDMVIIKELGDKRYTYGYYIAKAIYNEQRRRFNGK